MHASLRNWTRVWLLDKENFMDKKKEFPPMVTVRMTKEQRETLKLKAWRRRMSAQQYAFAKIFDEELKPEVPLEELMKDEGSEKPEE
jgi:hypothetical protein